MVGKVSLRVLTHLSAGRRAFQIEATVIAEILQCVQQTAMCPEGLELCEKKNILVGHYKSLAFTLSEMLKNGRIVSEFGVHL